MTSETLPLIHSLIKSQGFTHYGFSELENPLSLDRYEEWLNQGFHGEMEYLKTHLPFKKHPSSHFKGMRSALVITKPYFPPTESFPSPLRIAEYARGKDYHLSFQKELNDLKHLLQEKFPEEEFLCFTDSAPLLERDLSARAGVGWIGKNTCTIDRQHGSLFFLGEILTSLNLESQSPRLNDFCGTCSKCIEICPTSALQKDRVLDATRCISYLTIESKKIPPKELRPLIGDWFFGCDLCQTVCPWNEKVFGKELMRERSLPLRMDVDTSTVQELRELLLTSNKQLMERFKDSPLSRARGFGLKRNALVVIGNLQITALKEEVLHTSRQWPRLTELCDWVLERLEDL